MIKLWKFLRGYKRQAGAIVMFLMIILPQFGVVIPEELKSQIMLFGTIIFGVGWIDRASVIVKDYTKKE